MAKIAALVLALLITATAETLLAYPAGANPLPSNKPVYAEVSIQSPENTTSSNTPGPYGSSIQLSFNIKTNRFVQSLNNYSDSHCFIYLNSKSVEFKGLRIVEQTKISNDNGYDPYTQLTLYGNGSVSNLATGTYTLEVKYGFYYAWPNNSYTIDYIVLSSAGVLFNVESNVDPGSEPIISVPTIPSDQTTSNKTIATSPDNISQGMPTIYIRSDGSIEGTNKILRQGNVYTLTDNISGSIEVQKNDVVIDGVGYTLQGRKRIDERGVYLVGPDRSRPSCTGVLVKNLRIFNFYEGIFLIGSSNDSIIGNYLDNSGIHIIGGANLTGDLIMRNILKNSGIFVDYNNGGLDVITENNFVDCTIFVDLSAPPKVDRNYWSDYTANYPDAKEIDGSGIWGTPYVYDRFVDGSHGNDPCIDYHPLVRPTSVEAFPDAEPSESSQKDSFPILLTATVLFVVAAAVVIGALVCLKKRKPPSAHSELKPDTV